VTTLKNWTLNSTAAARQKFDGGVTWSVDDFDALEIQSDKSTKFDGAGVYQHLSPLLIYATADEADAYMFYRCFFLFFFCLFFVLFVFPSVKKYQTTVLGNG